MKGKTFEDLEGWIPLTGFTTLFGSDYEVYQSPDKTKLAGVHMGDGQVSMILEKGTSKILYLHPTTVRGMKAFGVTEDQVQRMVKNIFKT